MCHVFVFLFKERPPIDQVFKAVLMGKLQDPQRSLTTLRKRPWCRPKELNTAPGVVICQAEFSFDALKDTSLNSCSENSLLCMNGLLNFVSQRDRSLEELNEFSNGFMVFIHNSRPLRKAQKQLRLELGRPAEGGPGRPKPVEQIDVTKWLISTVQNTEVLVFIEKRNPVYCYEHMYGIENGNQVYYREYVSCHS